VTAEQRSPEWFKQRLGKVTASRVSDILKTIKNGSPAASRRNYAAQLVSERLTGRSHDRFYNNEHMDWGRDQEPAAKEAYTARTGLDISEVGLIEHPEIAFAAASPDGLVGDDGLVEIKCLLTANHIDMLLEEDVKDEYRYQVLWQLACTRRKWCDFISFDPTMPEDMQLFIKRFVFDDKEIEALENEIKTFLHEVAETVERLQKLR
jgi:putative phage-type endonuclease